MPGEGRKWYAMARAEASDSAVVRIFGDIGESWWGDSVSAAQFAKDLDALGSVKALEVRLNSPGGDMFDGVAIFNTLRNHDARVTVYVDGLAASAASIVAMAADELVMGTGTQLMIHNAWMFAIGDANDLRKEASVLDGLNESMATDLRRQGRCGTARRVQGRHGRGDVVPARRRPWPPGWLTAWYAARVRHAPDDSSGRSYAAVVRSGSARYRYKGRAHAPAPTFAAKAETGTGGHVEIKDEDFAALRDKLGLEDGAEIGDVLDALDEQSKDPEPAAKAKPVAGVVQLDESTLAELQADAALGREAREQQVKDRRAAVVDAAIAEHKVPKARRDYWLAQIAADEEGITETLAALTPLFSTKEQGHEEGAPEAAGDAQAVRQSPAYKNWKVI
jgi:ATP-dependent protease ClpP protease subunit